MLSIRLLLLTTFAIQGLLSGQTTRLATATAAQSFTLRGVEVNPSGVPSWPVMPGDETTAGSGPVTFTFENGSRVAVAPGSRARVELAGGKPLFRLLSGEAAYDLKRPDSVVLAEPTKVVTVSSERGSYSVSNDKRRAGFWTPRNIAVVLGSAAAAGTGLGVVATSTPPSVSPSQ